MSRSIGDESDSRTTRSGATGGASTSTWTVGDDAILYLGKADRCTVRERWCGRHKDDLREWLADEGTERVYLHVGEIDWGEARRYSPEKLADLEALLIKRLQPPANIMGKRLRGASRPGTRVSCGGDWPCARSSFVDR